MKMSFPLNIRWWWLENVWLLVVSGIVHTGTTGNLRTLCQSPVSETLWRLAMDEISRWSNTVQYPCCMYCLYCSLSSLVDVRGGYSSPPLPRLTSTRTKMWVCRLISSFDFFCFSFSAQRTTDRLEASSIKSSLARNFGVRFPLQQQSSNIVIVG